MGVCVSLVEPKPCLFSCVWFVLLSLSRCSFILDKISFFITSLYHMSDSEMPSDDEGSEAINSLNGTSVDGRVIVVKKAEPRPAGGGGGGAAAGSKGGGPQAVD